MTDGLIATGLTLLFVPAALFVLGYGLFFRWWRSREGAALLSSALAWALVSGIFLVEFHVALPQWVWLPVLAVATTGAWLKFTALASVWESRRWPHPLRGLFRR